MPSWKKIIVSGSDASLSSLNVDGAITASSFSGDGSGLTGVGMDALTFNKNLSEAFEKNIGKFDWPVISGFISNKFGDNNHPILKNIKIKNDGIDIQTKKDSRVKSIFSGIVSTVAFIPGMNNVIIIKHGNYFSLYARLKNLKVEKGDVVKSGDYLADVITNNEGTTELHFQICNLLVCF